jgi:hypothetical protein
MKMPLLIWGNNKVFHRPNYRKIIFRNFRVFVSKYFLKMKFKNNVAFFEPTSKKIEALFFRNFL